MSNNDASDVEQRIALTKLFLEFVKTVIVVGGIFIALDQLKSALDARHHARFDATAQFLSRFGDPQVLDAVSAFIEAHTLPKTTENYNNLLVRLTPTRQLFITWAACISEGICLDGSSRELLCQRLLAYEFAFREMSEMYQKAYNADERRSSYFGEMEKCEADFAVQNLGLRKR